jgi:hypothetical protein
MSEKLRQRGIPWRINDRKGKGHCESSGTQLVRKKPLKL